jgi:hypothetical protein
MANEVEGLGRFYVYSMRLTLTLILREPPGLAVVDSWSESSGALLRISSGV